MLHREELPAILLLDYLQFTLFTERKFSQELPVYPVLYGIRVLRNMYFPMR